jgi:hypothetical protein
MARLFQPIGRVTALSHFRLAEPTSGDNTVRVSIC